MSEEIVDDLVASLIKLLTDTSAHVRFSAVHTLRELGLNRDDVILSTIPLLEDLSSDVRMEAKALLREIAG